MDLKKSESSYKGGCYKVTLVCYSNIVCNVTTSWLSVTGAPASVVDASIGSAAGGLGVAALRVVGGLVALLA